jgi:lysophospholipase L1-like esterase
MQDTYDTYATSDHNTDGGGKTSAWGLTNIASYFSRHQGICVIEFGLNDIAGEIAAADTASNLIAMYTYVAGLGAQGIVGLVGGDATWRTTYLPTIESALTSADVPFVRLYDAIDSTPGNGTAEAIDEDYIADLPGGAHPNTEGHRLMGIALWTKLSSLGWV